jgi:hypothetical protein
VSSTPRRYVLRYLAPTARGSTEVETVFQGSGAKMRAEIRLNELLKAGTSVTLVAQDYKRNAWITAEVTI